MSKKNYFNRFDLYMEEVIEEKRSQGKHRTSETYNSSLASFRRFAGHDILFSRICRSYMQEYESFLREGGLTLNSCSFYMRNLRAVYNRAVDVGLTKDSGAFKRVYTGVQRTNKRALPLTEIRRISCLDLSRWPRRQFARDIFLFSFYTRGMSFVDIAYLLKNDVSAGVLSYHRQKTGQALNIKWEKCMQDIVDRYSIPKSDFLLPLIQEGHGDARVQYLRAAHSINYHLSLVGAMISLPVPLTMYVARHSWASIAKEQKVPLSVISESLGHDSEKTTRIYLGLLDHKEIDAANRKIISLLG